MVFYSKVLIILTYFSAINFKFSITSGTEFISLKTGKAEGGAYFPAGVRRRAEGLIIGLIYFFTGRWAYHGGKGL